MDQEANGAMDIENVFLRIAEATAPEVIRLQPQGDQMRRAVMEEKAQMVATYLKELWKGLQDLEDRTGGAPTG